MNTRNLKTRILSMLLVLVMVFGMVPMQAFAADNATVVDAAIIFSDLHTSNGNYKESAVKNIMTAFKNTGLPFTSVTSGGDAFSSNESTYTAYTDTITGYIRNVLGNSIAVNYTWSDHDRGAYNNSSQKVALDKTSRLVYGAGNDGVYGTADDGNYYVFTLSMADTCTYDRYSTGFNYTASSNNRAKNGYTSTVPQAIENFKAEIAAVHKDRPLFIVSHQPLFDNRNDNGWAEDWFNAINEVATEMDVAFFYGHNHKYDSGSDYYYAKGSTMPVATRKFTNGQDWNFNYQVGSGWQYSNDLASVNKVLNFTHMCAGYLDPSSTGSTSNTTRQGTALAIAIYEDSIRYTTYNSNGIFTGSYAVDKTVAREFAVTEPVVPSEPEATEPTAPSEPEATEPTTPSEPPVSDEIDSEKVYVLVDAPVDGGKYLIVNQTLTNGDLSKDWDTDDDGMAVIRDGESIAYSYAVPKAGTITDANGKVYTKGYIEYTDENAVWTVHASGNAWTIENDGYYLNKGSDNGVTASKTALTWNYTANGDDSRLYNGSDYLYFTYYGGDRGKWRWRTGTESGTSSTRDLFFYQEVMLTAPDPEPDPDPTPDVTPDSNDVVVGDGSYSYVKVTSAPIQEGYYQLQNNHTSKYLTNNKTSNANRLNLDSNGQNYIWYIKPVSGGYTIQYGGPTGQYLNFSHENAAMSSSAQTVQLLNTNGYWGIGATSGNPAAYLAREGTSNTSGSVHGYASNDYKYPGDVGMDWNLYQRIENRKTYSVSASDVHHYLGQNDDQVQLTYSLLVNGAAGTLPAGGSWNFSTYEDNDGIVKNISSNGVITFNKVEGSCYIKVAYTWSEGTAHMYVKVTAERDPNACEHQYTAVTVDATCTKDGSITYTCHCGDTYTEVIKATGHDYTSKVTAPTCTEAGYTTYTCHCGESYVADEVAALGHDYETEVTAPTCTENGSIVYTCACGDAYTEIIAALSHAYETVTVEPTCVAAGSVTEACSRCGETSTEVIPALGHSYETVVTAPTCVDSGYTTYICHCGDSYVADEVAALGHTYESVTTAATCTEDGSIVYTCGCGETYTEILPALGHDYKAVVTAPTCTEIGFTTYICACGDAYVTDEVAALGHSHEAVITAPTCEEIGYTIYTCACGDSYITDEVAALGHAHQAVTTTATCTEDGSVVYTCHCGDTYTEVLAALGHDAQSVTTAPTCETEGYTTHTCLRCGEVTVDSIVAALGHAHETVTVEPTCVAAGSVIETCSRCGETSTEVIPALGHGYEAKVTAPTCTEVGYTTYTCHCGDTYVADEVAALGHDYKSVTTAATCTEDGSIVYTCACGDTYTEVIAALGHDYKAVVTAPTCETAGYTTYTCHCGDTYVADEVAALGHDYAAVVTAPTCEDAGYTTYTCACGDSYVADQVAALGHDYKSVTTAATCTEDGATVYTCACGDSYTVVIPAFGHSYEAVVTAPTCENGGFTTYTCACGHSYTANATAALGHSYTTLEQNGVLIHTCGNCGHSYTESVAWIAVGSGYVLDTDGIDVGSQHKYIVVGATKDYALTVNGTSVSATAVTIRNNVLMVDDASKMELWFESNNSREKNTYLLTQDGSKSVYHVSGNINYGHDSKGYWYFGSSSNGLYQLYDKDGQSWYLNYGYVWSNQSANRFAVSSKAQSVRLFKQTDSYARLTGDLIQTVADTDNATVETLLNRISIQLSANGADVTGTAAVTADMLTWNVEFDGTEAGTYTAEVTYQGVKLGSITVTVTSKHNYVTTVVAPTCESQGYTERKCTECGASKKYDYTDALGHSYTHTDADGYRTYTCTRCDHSYSEKLSFTYSQVSTMASGERFVITVKSGNKYYALSHSGNNISAVQVTVSGGKITSQITEDLLWSYNGGKLSYEDGGKTYYLYTYTSGWWGSTNNLGISTDNAGSVSFSSSKLKIGSVYLRYSSSKFSVSSSSSTVYLFQEK